MVVNLFQIPQELHKIPEVELIEASTHEKRGRSGKVGWIREGLAPYRDWISRINRREYGYNLYEPVFTFLQLGVYEVGDYYHMHQDGGTLDTLARKLSFSIILNPGEFEGGQLQFIYDYGLPPPPPEPYAVVFPSWVMHGVSPVTKGTRKSIVGWCEGTPWR